ncbi:TadE/TadG family type IV pilus assembly protein [Alkaliphilus hydrothermalis]|uniref:Heme/copper-type cytochrome/quinol oxidase subunit 2 n=1 Tax=Alkaliphilus hydrothermalis TaxID=1482730 RepID=A0ABS2NSH4_9FIRM|nr:TadE family protein [Alkaliphilus hydrothermalis]MBM7615822.1 heme/copper-type cytochrome/quinol oxidase subunit 2 [Alkaliphilus hydrothermalis]
MKSDMDSYFNLYEEESMDTPKEERGSMTVELALIFPFIILTILSVIYMVVIMYQYAHLQSLVNTTAEGVAIGWGRISSYDEITPLLDSGSIGDDEIKTPLYWRLTLLVDTATKEKKVADYLAKKISEKSVLGLKESNVKVVYKDLIIYREVNISLAVKYNIPLPLVGGLNILGNQYTVEVDSKSIVKDSAEFIRNVDLATNLMDDFELTKAIKEQYNENINLIKEKIGDLLQSQ